MKKNQKIQWLFALLLLCGNILFAQTAKDVFNSSSIPITYLGIDFSQSKLIGDPGAYAAEIRDKYYQGINGVVVNEPKKYDFMKAFEREVPSDLSFVEDKNAKADAAKILSSNSADFSRFTPATIDEIVRSYSFSGKKGVGLLFIMESMSKTLQQAAVYVTLVNMETRKVIFTDRVIGKAGGFGFRNYWAKSIDGVLNEIQKSKLKEWKMK
jgi:hypothetical protein